MSDNRSRHDRGGSLITHYQPTDGRRISVTKTLSDEFGVTERTLQRDFHQRLVHGFRVQKWRQPQTTEQPGAIPEMLSFIQNTGIARILPLRNGRLITCLTDNRSPLPALSGYRRRISLQRSPSVSRNSSAIRQCIHISLMTERWYPSLEPCRLIYYSGSWYLIALQKGKLQVFPLADIKSVSLTSERFERRPHPQSGR